MLQEKVDINYRFSLMPARQVSVNHRVSEPSEVNQDNSAVQEVIDGILAKLQIPRDYSKLI